MIHFSCHDTGNGKIWLWAKSDILQYWSPLIRVIWTPILCFSWLKRRESWPNVLFLLSGYIYFLLSLICPICSLARPKLFLDYVSESLPWFRASCSDSPLLQTCSLSLLLWPLWSHLLPLPTVTYLPAVTYMHFWWHQLQQDKRNACLEEIRRDKFWASCRLQIRKRIPKSQRQSSWLL